MMMRSDFSTLQESKGEIISYGDMPITMFWHCEKILLIDFSKIDVKIFHLQS
jgi:hypothetical protein